MPGVVERHTATRYLNFKGTGPVKRCSHPCGMNLWCRNSWCVLWLQCTLAIYEWGSGNDMGHGGRVQLKHGWHTVTHGWGSEGKTGELSGWPVPFTLPCNMVYPALLPLNAHISAASSRLNWRPCRNWLVRFAERRNLVSPRVPSHFKRSLPMGKVINPCKVLVGNLKEIDHLNNLYVDGRIILYYNIIMDSEGTELVGVK